jgi:phenylalanyl-tRNA synthetase beta chain
MLRTTILPNLLEILSFNQHRELPQRIFEVGDVVASGRNDVHLAAVAIDPRANFSEIRSIVDAVMHERVVAYEITESDDPAFIRGQACRGLWGSASRGDTELRARSAGHRV